MAVSTAIENIVKRNAAEVFADATASSGAATAHGYCGVITSESLSTAHAADYTLTITNKFVVAGHKVFASVQTGSNTTVGLHIHEVTPSAGQIVILVRNDHASAALNGTIKVSYLVL